MKSYRNGLNVIDLFIKSAQANEYCKTNRQPVFLHMKTVRLMGHAGSDVELGYKSLNEIEAVEFDDPLLHTAKIIIQNNLLTKDDVVNLYEKSRERVSKVFDQA